MHVDRPFLKPLPTSLPREPTAGKIGEHVAIHGHRIPIQEMARESKNAAHDRREELSLPLVDVISMLEKLDIPLHHLGPGNIAPTPKPRRCWAGHARYGC